MVLECPPKLPYQRMGHVRSPLSTDPPLHGGCQEIGCPRAPDRRDSCGADVVAVSKSVRLSRTDVRLRTRAQGDDIQSGVARAASSAADNARAYRRTSSSDAPRGSATAVP